MNQSNSRYEYFNALHNDFSELYPAVNHNVISLYEKPRNFIMETAPVIDGFLKKHTIPGQPGSGDTNARGMLQFINELDEFTLSTMQLFELHKGHVDQCGRYMQVKEILDTKSKEAGKNESLYIELTPKLIELHNGLRGLKERAEGMADRLNDLEQQWKSLSGKF